MAHHFQAHLAWIGAAAGPAVTYDSYSREYLIEIDGKPPLRGSSVPVYRGDPSLLNPEDLLVASLAACHMLWYLHLGTEADLQIGAYADKAEGTMDQIDGRLAFTEVVLHPSVTLLRGDPERAMALHGDANRECFIANSVNFPVRHQPTVTVSALE